MSDPVDDTLVLKEIRREIADIRRDLHRLRDQQASGVSGRKGIDIVLREGIQWSLAAIHIEKRVQAVERRISDMEKRRMVNPPLN